MLQTGHLLHLLAGDDYKWRRHMAQHQKAPSPDMFDSDREHE